MHNFPKLTISQQLKYFGYLFLGWFIASLIEAL